MKIVRLGTKSTNEFISSLNDENQLIQEQFQKNIEKLVKMIPTKVMLGDSTVVEQKTFDPADIQKFFKKITDNLADWKIQDVSITNNEDIRRIFTKFSIKEGNYIISGHFSVQFHVLLYYKPDNKVIEYQKELSEIIDKTKNSETQLANDSDQFIIDKLKKMGYENLKHDSLFEIFFENDELREKIYNEIEQKTDVDFKSLAKRKLELFNELDNLLIETYQTTPVLIDDTRLVAGEEGCLCTFDIEFVKNNINEGVFDPNKIPEKIKTQIKKRLNDIHQLMII